MRKTDIQDYTNVALDANGLANDVAYAAGGYALTANDAGDSLAHLITILGNAVTNHSAKTFTITGTDENDNPLSEELAGPNGNVTVTSTRYFKTVESVTVSATTGADTFDIGWTAGAVGPWVRPYLESKIPLNIGIGCTKGTGSPNYSIRYTYDASAWFTHADLSGETSSQAGTITYPCLAFQLIWTAAGQVTMTAVQPIAG